MATKKSRARADQKTDAGQPDGGFTSDTAAEQRGDSRSNGSQDDRLERIALAAYYRAERRGFSPGFETDDWLAAEAEVDGGESDNRGQR